MKKFTAIIIMTALLCSFTACANDTADEVTDGEEISETSENVADYKEALEMYFDCMNNHDIDGKMKLTFPDKYIDTIKFMRELSGETIGAVTDDMETSGETVRLSEIISEENSDDIEEIYEYYAAFQLVSDYIDETGKENIDLEKYLEKSRQWAYDVDREQLPKPYFNINDIHKVTCMLEYDDKDGDTYTQEQAFTMFYIDGEGWKVG